MAAFFRGFECVTYVAAVFMLSGALMGLYLKAFNMAPPAPSLVVHLPVMGAMGLIMVVRFRETALGAVSVLPFVLIGILAVVSFKWSQDPAVSLREGLISLFYTFYLGMLAWRYKWERLIDGLWYGLVMMGALSLLLFVAVPSIGQMQEIFPGTLSGLWLEKNQSGQIAAFGVIVSLARIGIKPKTAIGCGVAVTMFLVMLILSTSKTSLVACLVGILLFGWVFMMRRQVPVYLLTLWTTVFSSAFIFHAVRNNTDVVLAALGKNATFTGRSEIWKALEISMADKPLLGHGYGAFWEVDYLGRTLSYVYSDLGFMPQHAHNSFVDMQLNLGHVGLYLLIAGLALAAVMSFKRIRASHGAYLAIPFIGAALIVGSFESVLALPANIAGAFIILIAAKMVRSPLPQERMSAMKQTIMTLAQSRRDHVVVMRRPNPVASGIKRPIFVHAFATPLPGGTRPSPRPA